jgi:hypothetical protein
MTSGIRDGALGTDTNSPPTADSTMRPIAGDGPGATDSLRRARYPIPSPTSLVRQARMAGLLYLLVAVFGAFAQIVRVRVYAPDSAAMTAANVVAHASLVRLSFVADLVQALVWLVLAMVLYRVLRHAGRSLARAMVIFVVVSVGITMLNMVFQLGALLVATTPTYAGALGPGGSHALVLLLMNLQHYGYLIAQLSWLWLFAIGLLGYRSGVFPRPLSVLLMLGTVCYVVDALLQFLAPNLANVSANVFVLPETLSEVSLLAYLLIKGVRTPRPNRATLATS